MPTEKHQLTESEWLHYRLLHTKSTLVDWLRKKFGAPPLTKAEIVELNREEPMA